MATASTMYPTTSAPPPGFWDMSGMQAALPDTQPPPPRAPTLPQPAPTTPATHHQQQQYDCRQYHQLLHQQKWATYAAFHPQQSSEAQAAQAALSAPTAAPDVLNRVAALQATTSPYGAQPQPDLMSAPPLCAVSAAPVSPQSFFAAPAPLTPVPPGIQCPSADDCEDHNCGYDDGTDQELSFLMDCELSIEPETRSKSFMPYCM